MHILITGGTGFIGSALCSVLVARSHTLCILTRHPEQAVSKLPPGVVCVSEFSQISNKEKFDAVINLAGQSIARRWTEQVKAELISSRVGLTKKLVKKIAEFETPPKVLMNGSAIGFYGSGGEHELTEHSTPSDSFGHQLCLAWEHAAYEAEKYSVRVCCLRMGMVLGSSGGALERMRLAYLMGMGGPIGSGNQWFSWIHLDDLIRMILFCLEHTSLSGALNATSPSPVQQKDFAKIYGKILRRPAFLPMPPLTVRLLFGQMGEELMLQSQKVIPQRLLDEHFSFLYPNLEQALMQIERPSDPA